MNTMLFPRRVLYRAYGVLAVGCLSLVGAGVAIGYGLFS